MSKIYIVGIVASGKTTLAKQLSVKSKIPWYELDCIVHQETETGRYKRTPEEQIAVIQKINQNDDWIIEGTYREILSLSAGNGRYYNISGHTALETSGSHSHTLCQAATPY